MFPTSFLDELRDRTALAEIIGRTVKLTKKGREYSGLCPFHSEKSPSFTVNEEKGFYHCFGCGAHGDAISFVSKTQNMGFAETVRQLAQLAGLQVPEMRPEEQKRYEAQNKITSINQVAADWFRHQLLSDAGKKARDYLMRREIAPEMQKKFGLGFAPDSREELQRHLTQKKFALKESIDAGLLIAGSNDGYRQSPIDRFRDRLMFPIHNNRGDIIAFGGRILGQGEPKYLNSPETAAFHKGKNLYAMHWARQAAAKAGNIIVAEGYMDVIALHQFGFEQSVAPLGTALTEDQLQILWKFTDKIYVCFDGDGAGQRAALRVIDRALPILRAGKEIWFVTLPEGYDPDSLLLSQGASAMQRLLERALPLHRVVFESELRAKKMDTPEAVADLRKRLFAREQLIQDAEIRRIYGQFLRDEFDKNFGPRPQSRHFTPRGKGKGGAAPTRIVRFAKAQTPELLQHNEEAALLQALLNHPGIIMHSAEKLGLISFGEPRLEKLRQAVLRHVVDYDHIDADTLMKDENLSVSTSSAFALLQKAEKMYPWTKAGQTDAEIAEIWQKHWTAFKAHVDQQEMKHLPEEALLTEEGFQNFVGEYQLQQTIQSALFEGETALPKKNKPILS